MTPDQVQMVELLRQFASPQQGAGPSGMGADRISTPISALPYDVYGSNEYYTAQPPTGLAGQLGGPLAEMVARAMGLAAAPHTIAQRQSYENEANLQRMMGRANKERIRRMVEGMDFNREWLEKNYGPQDWDKIKERIATTAEYASMAGPILQNMLPEGSPMRNMRILNDGNYLPAEAANLQRPYSVDAGGRVSFNPRPGRVTPPAPAPVPAPVPETPKMPKSGALNVPPVVNFLRRIMGKKLKPIAVPKTPGTPGDVDVAGSHHTKQPGE